MVQIRTDPALRDSLIDSHLRMAGVLDAWIAGIRKAPDQGRKTALADSLLRGYQGGVEVFSFIMARLHEEEGNPAQALTALRRRNRLLGDYSPEGLASMLRMEGRLAARTGDRDTASRAYRAFLWWYSDPEPSRVALRDSVRAELEALLR